MKKKCVLIVDDLTINRSMLSDIFESGGYEVLEACDGLAALQVLEKQADKITLMILDLMMPKLDGFGVLERMRADSRMASVPVIINTVAGESANELQALKLGALDFITKPYIPEVVMRRADNLLERIELGQRLAKKQTHELEAAFDMLTEIIPGGVATFRLDGAKAEVAFCNKGFYDLCGTKPDDPHAKAVQQDVFSVLHPSDRKKIMEHVHKAVRGEQQINETCRFQHSDGSYRWVRLTASRYLRDSSAMFYIAVLQDITEEIDLQIRFKFRLEHDAMTGIWNRDVFCRKTQRMLRKNKDVPYSLVCLDIDNFKAINELFGTDTGDVVLCSTAKAVEHAFDKIGTCCRLEADHFAWCIPTELLDIDAFTELLNDYYQQMHLRYSISVRYGIYEIEDPTMAADLMCDRANIAACTIRPDSAVRYAYYDDTLRTTMLKEQDIVASMDLALQEHQFQVYYQPLFSASTHLVTSAEALVRWIRPGLGMVRPDEFLRVFEKNGLITKLDLYIWEEVCRYLSDRIREGKCVVPVSVNMSRLDIYHPNLFEYIQALVAKYDLSPDLLKFEITENLFIENQGRINELVGQLQKAGFAVLMDDFGSGYSSLNTLKDLPVDILKIDRAFITDISTSERGASILSSIIRLSQRLEIPVVAEGIETKEQLDYICGLGCDTIQGYYFSKPLPESEFSALLDRYQSGEIQSETKTEDSVQPAVQSATKNGVLVVDDNAINRRILRKMLSAQYEVFEAENGAEAMALLESDSDRISVVLLDIIMPVMNGYEFLQELRGRETEYSDLPVIAMTEATSTQSEITALECGASDYMKKPYDAMLIKLRITNLLRRREQDKRKAGEVKANG